MSSWHFQPLLAATAQTFAPGTLPAGTKLYLLGDSIFQFGLHVNAVTLNFSNTAKSELQWAGMAGTLPWKHFAYDNPGTIATVAPFAGANLGIAGETAWGLLNGTEALLPGVSNHLNACCNMDPGVVVLAIGTNSGNHGDGTSAPQTIDEIEQIIERLLDAGHLYIALADIRPRDDLSGASYIRMDDINAWHAAVNHPQVRLWTPNAALSSDGHTYANAGDRYDLIHPTATGAWRAGLGSNNSSNSLSYVLRSLYEDANWFEDDLSAVVNKARNGRLTGNTGVASSGASGDVPDLYTVSCTAPSAVSCVCTLEANAVTGGQNLVMVFTSTGAGASTAAGINYEEFLPATSSTLAQTGFISTDFFQMWTDVEVDDLASQILGNVYGYCRAVGSWTMRSMGSFGQVNIQYPQAAFGGWQQTDPKPVGAATSFQQRLWVNVRGDVAGTATVKLKGVSLQAVGDPMIDFPYDGVDHSIPGPNPSAGSFSGLIRPVSRSIVRSIPKGLF